MTLNKTEGEQHWAHDAPETLTFVTGKWFYANMDDESRSLLDKLAEFERQRNAARDSNSKHSEVIEDRERLSKLAEKQAEDLRIARIDCMNNAGQLQEADARIKELEGMVALQAEAINNISFEKDYLSSGVAEKLDKALSASAETVQAFRDKLTEQATEAESDRWVNRLNWIHSKYDVDGSGCESGDALDVIESEIKQALGKQEELTEPLWKEVALLHSNLTNLRDQIQEFAVHFGEADFYTGDATKAIIDTQAAAQAYEQEVEARGAVKALEEAADWYDEQDRIGNDAHSGQDELRRMAAELRAISKKG